MNVFILGNGFDLQHHFPTKYINFLNTTNFLKNKYDQGEIKTVGDVFSSSVLQEKDEWIAECYLEHEFIYKDTYIDHDKIKTLIDGAKGNYWFKYFSTCFAQDKGWIDFEKEIAEVIEAFRVLFGIVKPQFAFMWLKNRQKEYICSKFDFYYDLTNSTYMNGSLKEQSKAIKEEFCFEKLSGSKIIEVNKQKILSKLYSELRNLANLLKLYLEIFVEEPLLTMKNQTILPRENSYSKADKVISFNYTSTFNHLYTLPQNTTVGHIHGTVHDEIVLGVNPDRYDEIDDLDTAFIQFKKYYQRVFFNADESYNWNFLNCNLNSENICLYIIGHSLDITDSDILKEWIERAARIVIYYHDENVIGSYIKNLVAMFGKKEFDNIRKNKNLLFVKNPIITFIRKTYD